jgi:hypothetical protein
MDWVQMKFDIFNFKMYFTSEMQLSNIVFPKIALVLAILIPLLALLTSFLMSRNMGWSTFWKGIKCAKLQWFGVLAIEVALLVYGILGAMSK